MWINIILTAMVCSTLVSAVEKQIRLEDIERDNLNSAKQRQQAQQQTQQQQQQQQPQQQHQQPQQQTLDAYAQQPQQGAGHQQLAYQQPQISAEQLAYSQQQNQQLLQQLQQAYLSNPQLQHQSFAYPLLGSSGLGSQLGGIQYLAGVAPQQAVIPAGVAGLQFLQQPQVAPQRAQALQYHLPSASSSPVGGIVYVPQQEYTQAALTPKQIQAINVAPQQQQQQQVYTSAALSPKSPQGLQQEQYTTASLSPKQLQALNAAVQQQEYLTQKQLLSYNTATAQQQQQQPQQQPQQQQQQHQHHQQPQHAAPQQQYTYQQQSQSQGQYNPYNALLHQQQQSKNFYSAGVKSTVAPPPKSVSSGGFVPSSSVTASTFQHPNQGVSYFHYRRGRGGF